MHSGQSSRNCDSKGNRNFKRPRCSYHAWNIEQEGIAWSNGTHQRLRYSRKCDRFQVVKLLRRRRRLSKIIDGKSEGQRFLGFKRDDLQRVPGGEQNCQKALQLPIIRIFWLNIKLLNKYSHLADKKVLFDHDKEPAHSSAVASSKLVELGWNLLYHPSDSPDMAARAFVLFSNWKSYTLVLRCNGDLLSRPYQ